MSGRTSKARQEEARKEAESGARREWEAAPMPPPRRPVRHAPKEIVNPYVNKENGCYIFRIFRRVILR